MRISIEKNLGSGQSDSGSAAKKLKINLKIELSISKDDLTHQKYLKLMKIRHFKIKQFLLSMASNINAVPSMISMPPVILVIPDICGAMFEDPMMLNKKEFMHTDSFGSATTA